MAGRRKVDESLVKYFSKIKGVDINPKLNYEDFWNVVVTDTLFDDTCEYHGTQNECEFLVFRGEEHLTTFKYSFDECHNSTDPGDIAWNVILHDALTYIKRNKLITKTKKK